MMQPAAKRLGHLAAHACVVAAAWVLTGCLPQNSTWHTEIKRGFWGDNSDIERHPPKDREEAFAELLNAQSYYPAPAALGVVPPHVRAFGILLAQPDAAEVFADLTDRATSCGQLHGLSGLALVDPQAMKTRVPAFLKNAEPILMAPPGCFGETRAMKDIVSLEGSFDIAHGKYPENLKAMAESLKD
jgi:hypothetical protein